MRILQVAQLVHEKSGGLRTTVERLGAGYAQAGHDRLLIVPGAQDTLEVGDHGRVITLRSRIVPGTGGYRLFSSLRPLLDLAEGFRPDVVEISDKVSLWRLGSWARPRGIPSVLISHERLDAILADRLPERFPLVAAAQRWNRLVLGHVDVAVGASDFALDELHRCASSTPLLRIPLGVDLEVFHPRHRGLEDHDIARVVCVGRLSAEKRPDLAIDAIRILSSSRRVHLSMLGDGPERVDLQRRATGLDVGFPGHLDERARIASALAAADVAIAPCPAETFGLGALEALASGTPVVASDRGALPELVSRDAGRLARPSPEDIAAAVDDVLEGNRDTWRRAARRHAERFPWSQTVAAMLDLYAALGRGRLPTSLAA